MIQLTNKEKAERWDILQIAIRYAAETYRTRRDECQKNYEVYGADTGVIGAYNKGMADAFGQVAELLERWQA